MSGGCHETERHGATQAGARHADRVKNEYEAAGDALHWIRVSLLQIERFVANFLDFAEAGDQRDATAVTADAHFLLNACAHAENALAAAGRAIPADRSTTIRSLRNVHEHWDEQRKSFESGQHPKKWSGRAFAEAHPDHLPWTFKFDGTGTYVSALRLEDLWDDLAALEVEIAADLRKLAEANGLPPVAQGQHRGPFPRRESRVLGMALA